MDLAALQAEVTELEAALRVVRPCAVLDRVPFCPHSPTVPQRRFLELSSREAFYGGSAGGGKSDALIMGALQFVDRPGYAALLLRRSFPDLSQPDALIPRSHEWLAGTAARYSVQEHRWTFPSGATITFGYADSLADIVRQYQGAAYQYIGIDEIGQWREPEYQYLLSRMRRHSGTTIPIRMRCAGNPGGIGHAWVRARFVKPGAIERPFVPAKLADNPHLDADEYRRNLALLDPQTRRQLEDGDWDVAASGLIYHAFRRDLHRVPALPTGRMHYLLSMDFGTSEEKPTGGRTVWAWPEGSRRSYCVRSWSTKGGSPQRDADEIEETRATFPIERVIVDAGALGAGYLRDFRARFGEWIVAAEKKDKAGARRLMNGEMERGNVLLVGDDHRGHVDSHGVEWNLPHEWEQLRFAPDGLDADKSQPDHLSDAGLYGWRACYAWAEEAPAAPPTVDERAKMLERSIEAARIAQLLSLEENDPW